MKLAALPPATLEKLVNFISSRHTHKEVDPLIQEVKATLQLVELADKKPMVKENEILNGKYKAKTKDERTAI